MALVHIGLWGPEITLATSTSFCRQIWMWEEAVCLRKRKSPSPVEQERAAGQLPQGSWFSTRREHQRGSGKVITSLSLGEASLPRPQEKPGSPGSWGKEESGSGFSPLLYWAVCMRACMLSHVTTLCIPPLSLSSSGNNSGAGCHSFSRDFIRIKLRIP